LKADRTGVGHTAFRQEKNWGKLSSYNTGCQLSVLYPPNQGGDFGRAGAKGEKILKMPREGGKTGVTPIHKRLRGESAGDEIETQPGTEVCTPDGKTPGKRKKKKLKAKMFSQGRRDGGAMSRNRGGKKKEQTPGPYKIRRENAA